MRGADRQLCMHATPAVCLRSDVRRMKPAARRQSKSVASLLRRQAHHSSYAIGPVTRRERRALQLLQFRRSTPHMLAYDYTVCEYVNGAGASTIVPAPAAVLSSSQTSQPQPRPHTPHKPAEIRAHSRPKTLQFPSRQPSRLPMRAVRNLSHVTPREGCSCVLVPLAGPLLEQGAGFFFCALPDARPHTTGTKKAARISGRLPATQGGTHHSGAADLGRSGSPP
jgi:hypothetical protein